MIRIFTVTTPLNDLDPDAAVAMLNEATDKLRRLYPPLIEAAARVQGQNLVLQLRVSARDQWACFAAARKIGTNMLLRLKVPAEQGRLELVGTVPPATTLSAERGRTIRKGRKPRVEPSGAV